MSSRRCQTIRLCLIIFLTLALLPLTPLEEASANNRLNHATITDDTITITVPVELAGGNEQLANRWQHSVDSYWNHEPGRDGPFRWCNRDVQFVFDVRLVPAGERPSDPQRHDVYVRQRPEGDRPMNVVRWGLPREERDPTRHRARARWEHDARNYVIAHEFGHLLNLRDEFDHYVDEDGTWRYTPWPGRERSIMGNPPHGIVFQDHIDEVMDKHHLECGLQMVSRQEVVRDFHESGDDWSLSMTGRHFVEIHAELQEENGRLTGRGDVRDFELAFEQVLTGPEGYVCTMGHHAEEDASIPTFDVSGSREGDSLVILLPTLNVPVVQHDDCVERDPSGVEALLFVRRIDAELEDGRYEASYEWVDPSGTDTTKHHVVIRMVVQRKNGD